MSYAKKLQDWCRDVTAEYAPASRNLGLLSEQELADKRYVAEHLEMIGLTEMSGIIKSMDLYDYQTFIVDLEEEDDELII
jgi:hypothetical protein